MNDAPSKIRVGCIGLAFLVFVILLFIIPAISKIEQTKAISTIQARKTEVVNTASQAEHGKQALLETAKKWPILLADDFESNENNWARWKVDDETTDASGSIFNGAYQWGARKTSQPFAWREPQPSFSVGDFYLSVDTLQIFGAGDVNMGVVFRLVDDNYYHFRVSREWFDVTLWTGDTSTTLIKQRSAAAIKGGSNTNRLVVVAEGPHFTFFINGQYVGEVEDDHLASGKTGLALEIGLPGYKTTTEFDNFELRAPKP